uniref:Iodothyronine deiodinase n=1 Tax=Denticeps clupeoides TaxID=299321 RepID=A0AAY4BDJ7_9TELE
MARLVVLLSSLFFLCFVSLQTLFLVALSFFSPSLTRRIIVKQGEKTTMSRNPKFRYEDWGPTFMTWTFVRTVAVNLWTSLGQDAFVGEKAPDSALITLDGHKKSVYSFLKGNKKCRIERDFGDVADFLVVYIAEAHATDEWAFGNNVDIKQHKTLEERLRAAQMLVREDPRCPVVVDDMSDVTAIKYAALPERLYVLQGGTVIYKGDRGPWGYSPAEVRLVLQKMK